MNVVSSKRVFKIKIHVNGCIEWYNTYLVALGFTKLHRLDYEEIFSSAVKPGIIRLVLTLGLSPGWPLQQLDISNAFLHGDLQEYIYLSQPSTFKDPIHIDYVFPSSQGFIWIKTCLLSLVY
jgi:hypothetical protein